MIACDASLFGSWLRTRAAVQLFSAALFQLFEPMRFLLTLFCSNLSLRSASIKNFGRLVKSPSELAIKLVKPTSIPTGFPYGIISGIETSHCKASIAYQPDTRLTTRTCFSIASLGISRLWRNCTQPILGSLTALFLIGSTPI